MSSRLVLVILFGLLWSLGKCPPRALAIEIRTGAERETDIQLWGGVLNDYVKAGRVNYTALCQDKRLAAYTARLSVTDPKSISEKNDRLAFWINVYNAFTLKVICDNYPLKSINDLHTGGLLIGTVIKKTVWDKKFVVINGKEMSLNHIEHKIIRPVFKDPRAHFALVCASKSCPSLRSEPYVGSRLDAQLENQGVIFFAQPEKNTFDVEKRKAHLSKILDWYDKDFGKNDQEILMYVSRFLPESISRILRSTIEDWDIDHTRYDWSLNN